MDLGWRERLGQTGGEDRPADRPAQGERPSAGAGLAAAYELARAAALGQRPGDARCGIAVICTRGMVAWMALTAAPAAASTPPPRAGVTELLEEGINVRDSHLFSLVLAGCRLEHPAEPPVDGSGLTCNVLMLERASVIGHAEHGAANLVGAHIGHLSCDGGCSPGTRSPVRCPWRCPPTT